MPKTQIFFFARSGMNLDACKRAVRRLGGSVEQVRRTGEIRFLHDELGSSGMIDSRRKDAPRHATTWLRRLERFVLGPNTR
jgi:hypothetical protein